MPSPREMSCPELEDAVTAYLEGALDPADRERFETHARGCRRCGVLVERSRSVVGSLRTLEDGSRGASDSEKDSLAVLFREHGLHRPGRPHPRIPLGAGGDMAAPGDHLAYSWESEQDFMAAAGFIAAGAADGETCLLLGDEESNERLEAATRGAGLDTSVLRRQGRLKFASGMKSADALLELVGEQVEIAVDRGAPRVRVLGNLGWGRPDWPDDLELLRLEARVTEAVRRLPVVVMCAYDVRRLARSPLRMKGLECHPLTYRRGALRPNDLYVPAEQFLETLPR